MAERKKRTISVRLDCGKVIIGEEKKPTSRRSKAHPRTNKTYQNKLQKLTSKYRRLYRNSLKAKEKNPNAKKERFCDKYPEFKTFKKNYPLKEVGRTGETTKTVDSQRVKEYNKTIKRTGGILGAY